MHNSPISGTRNLYNTRLRQDSLLAALSRGFSNKHLLHSVEIANSATCFPGLSWEGILLLKFTNMYRLQRRPVNGATVNRSAQLFVQFLTVSKPIGVLPSKILRVIQSIPLIVPTVGPPKNWHYSRFGTISDIFVN